MAAAEQRTAQVYEDSRALATPLQPNVPGKIDRALAGTGTCPVPGNG
ncbi:hypothetical protein [Streptomyces sp. NPDC058371]